MTTLNWADLRKAAGEATIDAVPAGEYDVIVESGTVKPTSSGKDSIAVKFKIESGPRAGGGIFNNFVLSPENPNALKFFFQHMSALGLGDEYFAANPPLERVAADLTGRRCRVKVSIREWNDTKRNQVDMVLPPVTGPGHMLTPPVPSPGGVPPVSPAPAVPRDAVPGPPAPPVPPVPPVAAAPAPLAATPPAVPSPPEDDLPF